MSDDGKVIFLAFRNEKLSEREIGFAACVACRNKTFLMIHDEHDYPLIKCAACGDRIGRVGWAGEERKDGSAS